MGKGTWVGMCVKYGGIKIRKKKRVGVAIVDLRIVRRDQMNWENNQWVIEYSHSMERRQY